MLKKLAKLIDVKSIVTLVCLGVFAYLSIVGKVSAEQFLTVWTVIISFFFGSKIGKAEAEENKEKSEVKPDGNTSEG